MVVRCQLVVEAQYLIEAAYLRFATWLANLHEVRQEVAESGNRPIHLNSSSSVGDYCLVECCLRARARKQALSRVHDCCTARTRYTFA